MKGNIELSKPKQGLIPAVKSFFWGDPPVNTDGYGGIHTQTFWQRITGTYSFNTVALSYLVKTGYENNPIGFGAITKILLAQRNILFTPYWKGKPYISKTIDFDINYALFNLISTGTCVIWERNIVGFDSGFEVLDTLRLTETKVGKKYTYTYDTGDGYIINIPYEQLIFIRLYTFKSGCTNFGISPLQAAIMPIESLKEMYTADTAIVKNKGVDVLITNDSDSPLIEDEKDEMDKVLNRRLAGARRAGGVATSTSKLRVLNLGRTIKELALWDGYKIKARDLCTALQVDSGLFNDPDNKTYANREEATRSLYNECVIPFTKLITENKELVRRIGFEIYCDTSNIEALQATQAVRAEKAKFNIETVTSLNQSVKDGVITKDIAVKLLVSEAGYDEQEAVLLIIDKVTETSEVADKANTLSPIVATKVVESMTTNERRDLVGLKPVADGDTIPQDVQPTF